MAKENGNSSLIKLLLIAVIGIVVAIVLGTIFSMVYPKVEIDFSLSLLFMVAGLFVALLTHKVW